MYKLVLCWRYLRTRFLALACIVSVMLGVATLIVVNSVMSGFSEKLRDRLHKMMADVVVESAGIEGFRDPEEKMRRIKADAVLGPRVEAMAASMECFAMLQYLYPNGETATRPVRLVGVDAKTRAELGGFQGQLVNPLKRPRADFDLPPAMAKEMRDREIRELEFHRNRNLPPAPVQVPQPPLPIEPPPPLVDGKVVKPAMPDAPPSQPPIEDVVAPPQGVIVGNLIAGFRKVNPETKKGEVHYVIQPGDAVTLITVKGARLEPAYDRFVVVDYFASDMSEYDNQLVFVDLAYLQKLRAADNVVSNIQIKLKDYRDAPLVTARLQEMFPLGFRVSTWEQKQGPLLSAIDIEKGLLNFLLFLIVGVAGFGILAIFSMIVAEKTRDIGIMKSLGASNFGVMQIFLGYGLLLGALGACFGTLLGLVLTWNLNPIEKFLTRLTGRHIFDPSIYYFNEIPTHIEVQPVVMVNLGAVLIAVVFSILPALHAARLHPVRTLRYE